MSHSLPLITTIATALGLALILGFIAVKLNLPALVGYLLAGVFLGPFTPGFVANTEIAAELAEIGIMLLMFGVGLHFSLGSLLAVRKVALPGALIQIVVATLLGAGMAMMWGWGLGGAFVFGLALSVASTVVLIRALESQGILDSISGQIAVGWLIVEDLAMILVLVFLPLLPDWMRASASLGQESLWLILAITLLKITAFIVLILFVGRWVFPRLLWQIARTGSRELFTLCVIAAAVCIAYIASQLFGMSFALGAFFAGVIMRESKFSQRAAEESLPFRDAFAVLFFVSVGMLFNPLILINQPLKVLAVVSIIVVGKSIVAAILVLALRYSLYSALLISASLAQIGEFSFILAGLGVNLGLLPREGQELILAGALISIAMNPLLFKVIKPFQHWIGSKSTWMQHFARKEDPLSELPIATKEEYLSKQIILIGYGRIGHHIGQALLQQKLPFVVVEQNRGLVEQLRKKKLAAVFGDASESSVLIQAHIARAGMLIITHSDLFNTRQIMSIARALNPKIEAAIHVNNEEEVKLLKKKWMGCFLL